MKWSSNKNEDQLERRVTTAQTRQELEARFRKLYSVRHDGHTTERCGGVLIKQAGSIQLQQRCDALEAEIEVLGLLVSQ